MRKPKATITLFAHTPDHGDGSIRQGDYVQFAVTPEDAGVITLYGSRDGDILASWALVRGVTGTVLGSSDSWDASPGPLHVAVTLSELVHGKVRVVAETEFEIT